MAKKLKLLSLLLFPIALIINFISSKFPNVIEKYYSLKINKSIIELLSKVSGVFPFSFYEITMYLISIFIILFLLYFTFLLIKQRYKFKNFLYKSLLNILSTLSIVYFLFIILWGLNYNRLPLKDTLINDYNNRYNKNITEINYDNNDLINLYKFLIEKSNEYRKLVEIDKNNIFEANTNYKGILDRAYLGYENIYGILPGTKGNYSKPKYVRSSNLMCYTGITGIYFPFLGEANVNVAVPDLHIPSTTIHEMAHQRGYSSEDEANFIAYLGSINHPDVDFKYSGYILALVHTSNELARIDYDKLKELNKNISDDVRSDIKNNSKFWEKYEGKVEKISNEINNTYLKSNGIKEGVENYGEMVKLLLTYYKLYPEY